MAKKKPEKKKSKVDEIYSHFRGGRDGIYDEELHCKMLIKVMLDRNKGSVPAFCVEAIISEKTFWYWINHHSLFCNIYYFTKNLARELWEQEGRELRDRDFPMGTVNYSFEHWKLIGWSRYGVSKNPKLKINLDSAQNPAQHYAAILRQASDGDFTSSEFKQVMEAVNVGLNVHQVLELQKQLDELKSDLITMKANADVKNPFSNKGTAQTD